MNKGIHKGNKDRKEIQEEKIKTWTQAEKHLIRDGGDTKKGQGKSNKKEQRKKEDRLGPQ